MKSTPTLQIRNPDDGLAPAVVDRSVLIVMVVIGVIGVAAMIVPVVDHGVSDYGSPDAAHHRANRPPRQQPRRQHRRPRQ